jgi:hypothetical protein
VLDSHALNTEKEPREIKEIKEILELHTDSAFKKSAHRTALSLCGTGLISVATSEAAL